MITLNQFEKFLAALKSFYDREEEFNKALEPFNSSYTIIEFCPEITSAILEYLNEIFEDEGDWIGYWLFELEMGTRSDLMEGCSYANGDPIDILTVEKLYNFLIKNKEENNEA